LLAVCPNPGDRAAIDYREGVAVVQREDASDFVILTILEKWMAVDNLPLVLDWIPGSRQGSNHTKLQLSGRTQYGLCDLLSEDDVRKLEALA